MSAAPAGRLVGALYPLLLLETFGDPQRFHGTGCRAANWACVALTQGFRRTAVGYSAQPQTPKQVFVRAQPNCFGAVSDPRRAPGRRHPIGAVLAVTAGATLCDMRGYQAIGQWVEGLGQTGAQRSAVGAPPTRASTPSPA